GFVGIGVAIAGGNENAVHDNRITGSERYGVAIIPTARFVTFDAHAKREPGPPWRPRGNRVWHNVVVRSGLADLALSAGSGTRNCFSANSVRTTLPGALQRSRCAEGSATGSASVAALVAAPVRVTFHETLSRRRPPKYTAMPEPPAQPNMP